MFQSQFLKRFRTILKTFQSQSLKRFSLIEKKSYLTFFVIEGDQVRTHGALEEVQQRDRRLRADGDEVVLFGGLGSGVSVMITIFGDF
jgi:hypothetical protein